MTLKLGAASSVVIFASRETPAELMRTLIATQCAAQKIDAVIDVLVNGNPALANAMKALVEGSEVFSMQGRLRIWSIMPGDKAHAWNEYVRYIWAGETLTFFVDGYTRPWPEAFVLLSKGVMSDEHFLGGSGVPTIGYSAAALADHMVRYGGFAGGLCCIRGEFIRALRERKIAIPRGMYRTDSLMGAFLSFKLDPEQHGWDAKRIYVCREASWDVDAKRWWRWQDLHAAYKRYLRQAKGMFENRAVKSHIELDRKRLEELPETASDLIFQWFQSKPKTVFLFCLKNPKALFGLKLAFFSAASEVLETTRQLVYASPEPSCE